MPIATINISIPDKMKTDVEEIIATEGYGSTSEFFRDLIRHYLRQREGKKLESLLLEGLNSGKATPFTRADFEVIKQRGITRLKTKSATK
ncbi:MAG: type II toxin-antitoxin system ParD family antitoxin [Pyrinomonadaceae bacterium]